MIELNHRMSYRRDELHGAADRIHRERELRTPASPAKPEPTRIVDDRRPTSADRRVEPPCDGAKRAHPA